jgi:hypothetical protein
MELYVNNHESLQDILAQIEVLKEKAAVMQIGRAHV